MLFGINTTCDISKLLQIMWNNFEISLVVFMPNITTNQAITYTNFSFKRLQPRYLSFGLSYQLTVLSKFRINVPTNIGQSHEAWWPQHFWSVPNQAMGKYDWYYFHFHWTIVDWDFWLWTAVEKYNTFICSKITSLLTKKLSRCRNILQEQVAN